MKTTMFGNCFGSHAISQSIKRQPLFKENFREIKGYKFIAGKMVPRKWGTEYRFSVVSESTGKNYDDIVMVNPKADEKEIELIIEAKLSILSAVIPEPEIEKQYTQKEVDSILEEKKYIDKGKHFPEDLPKKTVESIKPK